MTRAAVVTAARAGDPAAWSTLYQRHARGLLSWLASLPHVDSARDADDIAGEAWMTAAAKIGEYTGTDDGFGGWLFTIARNHLLNSNRTAGRRATFPDADAGLDLAVPHPHDPAAIVAGAQHVRELLSHLTVNEAAVVAARDVAGLSVAETAAVTGLSAASVRVTRHRALRKLRKHLAVDAQAAGVLGGLLES